QITCGTSQQASLGNAGLAVGASGVGQGTGTVNAIVGYYANSLAGVSKSATAFTTATLTGGIITTWKGASDERLKNISPYEGGLNAVLAIHPVRFTWNSKGLEHNDNNFSAGQKFVGFTAQDVQKALPEAITGTEPSHDGTEEYLCFDDRPIVAALVSAIKELNAKVEALEARQGMDIV